MYLQGIVITPANTMMQERALRDLILKCASYKPDSIIFVTPTGHVFVDAISIDYFSEIKADDKEYKCDFGILDELNRLSIREKIPSIFINPEKREQFELNLELEPYNIEFLKYLSRVVPEFKSVFITAAPISKGELLETGRSIREAVEVNEHKSILVVFSNFSQNEEFASLLKDSIETNDFLPVVEYNPKRVFEDDYDSILIGIGATEQLIINSEVFGEEEQAYLLTFKVNEDSESKEKGDFITASIIEAWDKKVKEDREILKANESDIIKLVRAAVELWVKEGKRLNFDTYAQDVLANSDFLERLRNQRTGVFVAITKNGKPRGTMGTVNPITDNIAEEIINNSIEASTFDPQFVPINSEELDELSFEVNVMDPPEMVDSNEELDPQKYGIIVEQGLKRGVVLPGIEEVQTVEEQIELAKDRAGINDITDSWDPLIISRFTVDTF